MASACLGAPLRSHHIRRLTDFHGEPVAPSLDHRLDISLFPLFRREHERGCERHLHVRKRRVRAPHRTRPQPRDHRELPPLVTLQVGPLPNHRRCDLDLRIEMADPPLRLVAHPLPVVPNVLGETRSPLPAFRREVLPLGRVHRRPAGEPRRNLDHRLVDEHRHRVQVARVRLHPQPLRLQWDRPAPGEGIVESRKPVAVEQLGSAGMIGVLRAGPPPTLPDLGPGSLKHLLIGGALPADQFPEDLEQPLPLLSGGDLAELLPAVRTVSAPAPLEFPLRCAPLRRVGQQHVHVFGRIVHHLREQNRAHRSERPPRPPKVERRGMAVADGLLPRRRLVDGVERQRHLNQLPHGRDLPSCRGSHSRPDPGTVFLSPPPFLYPKPRDPIMPRAGSAASGQLSGPDETSGRFGSVLCARIGVR